MPVLYGKVRRELKQLVQETPSFRPKMLDIGGRKSPYTIGLSASITVLDRPQAREIDLQLHLGLTSDILAQLHQRRSNIEQVVLQDMTKCTLPTASFDCAVSVEVIEHVLDDESFVQEIARVLKPGGWLYLTTPNGDYIRNEPPNYNPDHVRHYTRQELHTLLVQYFDDVQVTWGIKTGKHRYQGLQSMNLRRPTAVLNIMAHNVINRFESRYLAQQPYRTAHLFAVAYKKAAK